MRLFSDGKGLERKGEHREIRKIIRKSERRRLTWMASRSCSVDSQLGNGPLPIQASSSLGFSP